jgi:hypothetical protein
LKEQNSYYKRSLKKITYLMRAHKDETNEYTDVIKEQQEEIDRLRQENKFLREELHHGNKELKGKLIRLENTLNK